MRAARNALPPLERATERTAPPPRLHHSSQPPELLAVPPAVSVAAARAWRVASPCRRTPSTSTGLPNAATPPRRRQPWQVTDHLPCLAQRCTVRCSLVLAGLPPAAPAAAAARDGVPRTTRLPRLPTAACPPNDRAVFSSRAPPRLALGRCGRCGRPRARPPSRSAAVAVARRRTGRRDDVDAVAESENQFLTQRSGPRGRSRWGENTGRPPDRLAARVRGAGDAAAARVRGSNAAAGARPTDRLANRPPPDRRPTAFSSELEQRCQARRRRDRGQGAAGRAGQRAGGAMATAT